MKLSASELARLEAQTSLEFDEPPLAPPAKKPQPQPCRSEIEIFTDGACSGNPGAGGWGAILRYGHTEKELCGGEDATTNNRMELTAVIEALQALKRQCTITIYTDSRYVMDGVQQWLPNWKRNNWRTSNKKSAVKNVDLWQRLDNLLAGQQISWVWIKGHAGHAENERVDKLARDEAQSRVAAAKSAAAEN